jgi:lipopolysaccharide export system protein LptA
VLYLTLKARKFQESGDGSSHLSGDVAMQFPYGIARAERATMTNAGKVTFTDNVRLLYGGQVMRGTKLLFDGHSGFLEMNGKRMPSGMPACDGPCR